MLRFVLSSLGGISIMDRLAPNQDGLDAQLAHLKDMVKVSFEAAARA